MSAVNFIDFKIKSVSIPRHFPCICHFCKKTCEREYQQKSLHVLLEEVFIYYKQDWKRNLQAELLIDLAVCYFLKRMQLAGRSHREAENFVETVVRNANNEDELEEIIDIDLLRQWKNLYTYDL